MAKLSDSLRFGALEYLAMVLMVAFAIGLVLLPYWLH